MDWLARRECSRCELEQKLARRFPDATAAIGPVLDQLELEGLLSDARFAESFVRSRANRGHGPRRIAADLRTRGISPAALHEAPDDWLVRAREVRARRFGAELPADAAACARQMRFLAARGFPADICRKACRSVRDD